MHVDIHADKTTVVNGHATYNIVVWAIPEIPTNMITEYFCSNINDIDYLLIYNYFVL